MEVYIEYAILDNFVMDYILLKATCAILKQKSNKILLIVATTVGTLGAVLMPLFSIRQEYLFLLKIALGALVAFIAKRHVDLFDYLKFFNVFLLLTFVVGGAIVGVLSLCNVEFSVEGYASKGLLPMGVNLVIAYLFVKAVEEAVRKNVNAFIKQKFVYDCTVKREKTIVKCSGYFDSGNKLVDRASGLPIVVCDKKFISKMQKSGIIFKPPKRCEYFSVENGGEMLLYEIDCITVSANGKTVTREAVLGAVENKTFNTDLLLGAYVL